MLITKNSIQLVAFSGAMGAPYLHLNVADSWASWKMEIGEKEDRWDWYCKHLKITITPMTNLGLKKEESGLTYSSKSEIRGGILHLLDLKSLNEEEYAFIRLIKQTEDIFTKVDRVRIHVEKMNEEDFNVWYKEHGMNPEELD